MKLHPETVIACKIVTALKGGKRLCAHKIAERIGYNKKRLETPLATLVKAGIIIGKRGCKGGYILVQDSTTLLDIIDATEGVSFNCNLLHCAIKDLLSRFEPKDVI